MYELIKLGDRTWYMAAPCNVGFWLSGAGEVCMIDAGGDKSAAQRALEHIQREGWKLSAVYLTHSHADHCGGAAYLHEQTGCSVYAPGVCAAAVTHSFLTAVTLYGGHTTAEMAGRLLVPPSCPCSELSADSMPQGLSFERLDGHDMAHCGYLTADGVWFTGDAVISEQALEKHRISFLHDVAEHLRTLDKLSMLHAERRLRGSLFVPAHDEPLSDISRLVEVNRSAVLEVAEDIKKMCDLPATIDEVIERSLEKYHIRLYLMQYLLVGQTVRSHISRLLELGELKAVYSGTKLMFQAQY